MAFRDMFKATEYKQRVEELESMLTPEMADADRLRREAEGLRKRIEEEKASLEKLEKQNGKLDAIVKAKESKSRVLDDELLVEEFGLYRPRFDFADSTHYKDALDRCRRKQKEAVKSFGKAADKTSWTVNGSASKGKAMVREISKLLMMAYNGECDEIVRKVKATNVERSLERIEKSAAAINRNGKTLGISIPAAYVLLKQEEVQLAFEFAQEKEEEKEALREAREQEREARKLEREIAAERKKLEKERSQYLKAYKDVSARLKDAGDDERADLEEKAAELKAKLDDVDRAVSDVDYREANQKAGFVYVISNIGSFGEGVYKIGMTRRLEPMDRIRELGDASVPFNFDVHALIFCDDAPKLEAALHRAFEDRKVNIVNQRREFFRVSLDEIEEVVKANYDKTVEFHSVPDAEQYRTSEKLRERGIFHPLA